MQRSIAVAIRLLTAAGICTLILAGQTPPSDPAAHALEIVHDMASGNFAAVEAQYTPAMKTALPPGSLASLWSNLTGQLGKYKRTGATSVSAVGAGTNVVVDTEFARQDVNLVVSFDATGRFAGFHLTPRQSAWSAPPYAHPNSFHEVPVTVVDGRWKLSGTLTTPNGNGPFPLIVLVQGSGPEDQDETIGPNRPFKDLAWGLASQGVAVLRYVKRTRAYGEEFTANPKNYTVKDEVTDDAIAAVALARRQTHINPNRIFLLGHSLGGYLAPRIAAADPDIAGLVILAGSTRPMEQIVVAQVRYLAAVGHLPAAQARAQTAAAEADAAKIESPDLKPGQMVTLAGAELPAAYFLDLRGYHPAAVAVRLKIPLLILQGARDYQVTQADYQGWRHSLAGHANVTFHLYPGLDHVFMESSTPGTGLGTPADYAHPGHIAPQVVADIAHWINAN